MHISLRGMGIAGVFICVSGCGTFYNASNDSAAKAASRAVSDAGLATALDSEREALVKQQTERLALVARVELAARDALIAAIVDGTTPQSSWGLLQKLAADRISKIAGKNAEANTPVLDPARCKLLGPMDSNTAFGRTLRLVNDRLQAESANATTYRSQLALRLSQLNHSTELTCSQPPVLPPEIQGDSRVAPLSSAYQQSCARVAELQTCAVSAFAKNSNIGQIQDQLVQISVTKGEIAVEVKSQRDVYTKLLRDADAAKPREGAAEELAKKLREVLDRLDKLSVPGSLSLKDDVLKRVNDEGRAAALEEKQAVLDGYLQALAGIQSDKASNDQHRVFLISSLINRVTSKTIPTAGILMEAEFTRHQLATTKARLARAEQAEQLYRRQRDHLMEELIWMNESLAHVRAAPKCTAQPLFVSLNSGLANGCSLTASRALLAFSAGWTGGRVQAEQDKYRLIDLNEQASLEESAVALAQTDAVIKTAVGQIAAVHANGIRPEHLAALAQALSLPAIAIRVK